MGDNDEEDFTVSTGRLRLRPPRPTDADAIVELADNPRVAQNLSTMPHPYRLSDATDWIAKCAAGSEGVGRAFAIVLAGEGRLIGACGYGTVAHLDGISVGYWIGEPFWGRGFATEAARAVIDRAFAGSRLEHLWCSCRVTNDASRRVIQKCGFQFHSAGMMQSRATGTTLAVENYCLGREVWRSLKGWPAFDGDPQSRLDAGARGVLQK